MRDIVPRMRDIVRRWPCLMMWLAAGCSSLAGGTPPPHPELGPFLGVYRGSFDSALTEDPGDDLNHNPCTPGGDLDCTIHHQPLVDVLLALRRTDNDRVTAAFYANEADLAAGHELDLLGRGCGTRLQPVETVETVEEAAAPAGHYQVAVLRLTTGNRLCLGKLRPTSRHQVRLELHPQHDDAGRFVRVVIDRSVRDDNYLYVVEDGVRRRVRIDLDNTVHADHRDRYRVCIEDDFGEYHRCVLTDRELRSFALPLPVPGGAAVSYTWWRELRPRLQRTEGRYRVERERGRFEPFAPSES